jgi:hypothetical protein
MAYKDSREWGSVPAPEASAIELDPVLSLAARVIIRALEDFKSSDMLIALDAFCWWLDPLGGPFWLDALDLPGDPDQCFVRILEADNGHTRRSSKAGNPNSK